MKWPLRYSVLGLAIWLALGLGCSSGPTEAPLAAGEGWQETDGAVMSNRRIKVPFSMPELLACEAQQYAVAEKTVGSDGGSLTIGRHKLEIPRGALASNVRIIGEQVSGNVNSVRLSPEGLRFAKPVRLILDYRNCASVGLLKRVAYTDEQLKILDIPPSVDYPENDHVTTTIDHFSRYAVAY
jgi:hypothetical protein